jgi:hypothetical protein
MPKFISEVDMKIIRPGLAEKHPELFHYTRSGGFDGISASQQIWATHFQDLNDTKEVFLLKKPLKIGLTKRFEKILEESQARSISFSLKVIDHGGRHKVAAGLADSFAMALYKVTYGPHTKLQFGAPYIASFTTHSDDYTAKHGLLSQWKEYGRDGYCLVFDTARLAEMLWSDFEKSYFVHLNMDEGIYALEDFDIEDHFGELMLRCEQYVLETLVGNKNPDMIEDGFAPFAAATTLFKHQGFREENEVRIVAIPGTQHLSDVTKAEFPTRFKEKPIVEPHKTKTAEGTERRHISLFSHTGTALPLKRVIVCPGVSQDQRTAHAEAALGGDIEVVKSETPWTG